MSCTELYSVYHFQHCMHTHTHVQLYLYTGQAAREEMTRSKLPNSVLRRIWNLADIDQDGMLDRDEFAVAMFLIDHKIGGNDIPETLPDRVIPPSKVHLVVRSHDEGRPSDDYSGAPSMTSHEASYSRDSGYDKATSYWGGGASKVESSYHGGGEKGGRYEEDTSGGGYSSSSRSRHTHEEYDEDSSHLSSFIDRGH